MGWAVVVDPRAVGPEGRGRVRDRRAGRGLADGGGGSRRAGDARWAGRVARQARWPTRPAWVRCARRPADRVPASRAQRRRPGDVPGRGSVLTDVVGGRWKLVGTALGSRPDVGGWPFGPPLVDLFDPHLPGWEIDGGSLSGHGRLHR